MNDIKISVIIPVYNMEKYIRECLESVFKQSLREIEVICVDDGSTDSTIDILRQYKESYSNMIILSQQRQGAGLARNRGMEVARGQFIAFMDSDDYYAGKDVLEYLYNGALKNNVKLAGGSLCTSVNGHKIIHPDKEVHIKGCDKVVNIMDFQYPYSFTRFIYEKELLESNAIIFPDLQRNEDPPFMLKALVAAKRIWLTSKEIYVAREFDKRIGFTSKELVCDIMQGYLEMMTISNRYCLYDAQALFIKNIFSKMELYLMHLNNGNTELYNLIQMVGKEILHLDERRKFMDFWNQENIEKVYCQKLQEIEKLVAICNKCGKVIIYGAGRYGKSLYDFICRMKKIEFLGFAVTELNPTGTARGYDVKSLMQYEKYKDEALVLIAVKNDFNGEMQKYARDIGYKNIVVLNRLIGYIGINQVSEEKFAVL